MKPEQTQWIVDNCLGPEYRIHEAITDGHGDAVFAILKPGVILSSKHDAHLHLATDFPGWEVLKIWDSSIWAAMEVGKFKYEQSQVHGMCKDKHLQQSLQTLLILT